MIDLRVSKENEMVIVPTKTEGNAGYDIYVDPIWFEKAYGDIAVAHVGETLMLSTGIRTVIDSGWYIQIQERGSTGTKAMKYGAGVIDSNFRGIHNVVITNCNNKPIVYYNDKKITKEQLEVIEKIGIAYPISKAVAQFVILPVPKVEIKVVSPEEILSEVSERGEKMLGSTNK